MRIVFVTVSAGVLLAAACVRPAGPCYQSCVRGALRTTCGGEQTNELRCQDDGRVCVEDNRSWGEHYALCAIGPPEARCDGDTDNTFCDGERVVQCVGRYRKEEIDCASAGLVCETVRRDRTSSPTPDARSACVASHAPDPSCEADARTTWCDGDALFGCFGAFRRPLRDCAAEGKFCRTTTGGACVLDPAPHPRCGASSSTRFCEDEHHAALCGGSYVVARRDCGEERCVERDGTIACQ